MLNMIQSPEAATGKAVEFHIRGTPSHSQGKRQSCYELCLSLNKEDKQSNSPKHTISQKSLHTLKGSTSFKVGEFSMIRRKQYVLNFLISSSMSLRQTLKGRWSYQFHPGCVACVQHRSSLQGMASAGCIQLWNSPL